MLLHYLSDLVNIPTLGIIWVATTYQLFTAVVRAVPMTHRRIGIVQAKQIGYQVVLNERFAFVSNNITILGTWRLRHAYGLGVGETPRGMGGGETPFENPRCLGWEKTPRVARVETYCFLRA